MPQFHRTVSERSGHKAPPTNEWYYMLGNEGELTGKDAQGILKFEGDQLSLCYTMPGGDRPVAFQSKPGSRTFYIVWQRP